LKTIFGGGTTSGNGTKRVRIRKIASTLTKTTNKAMQKCTIYWKWEESATTEVTLTDGGDMAWQLRCDVETSAQFCLSYNNK